MPVFVEKIDKYSFFLFTFELRKYIIICKEKHFFQKKRRTLMYTKKLTDAAKNAVKNIDALNAAGNFEYEAYEEGIERLSAQLKADIANAESDYDPTLPTFYVSNNGDDNADGMSPETAWKTLDKINLAEATPEHCNILFERGGVWRGRIVAPHEYITYSAYGEGKKPCLYGSQRNYADPALWEKTEYPNVWRTTACGNNIGIVAINHSDEYGRYDELVGVRRVRGRDGFEGPQNLRRNYEYWSNVDEKELYLCCLYGNPGEVFESIELGERWNLISGGHHIKVDNLCVKFTGAHGVGIGGRGNFDYTIQNCVFAYLGGSILTGFGGGNITGYGNAIQVYGQCDGYYVNGNWIYQIYDTAITHQFSGSRSDTPNQMKDVEYIGNLCEFCHWSIEYYNPASVTAPETPRTVKNVNVSHNVLRYGCYGWGSFGRQDEGALFNSFNMTDNTENFEAHSNILDRCFGKLVRLNVGGDEKLISSDNVFIQKKGRSFGFFYGKNYTFDDNAGKIADELFHDKSAKIIYSKA